MIRTVQACLSVPVLLAASAVFAQQTTLGPASSAPAESQAAPPKPADDLAHGRRLLENVHDGAFSFDDPGFYWFCRYVKDHADPAAFTITEGETTLPWKFLMERPSDYRGQLVLVEGTLLSRPAFEVAGLGREDIGRLYECELGQGGTRAICSVICIDSPESIPIRSPVRAKGFFIKYRSFTLQTPGRATDLAQTGAGPLIIARRLEAAPAAATPATDWTACRPSGTSWLVIAIAAMVVVWLVLRRAARRALPPAPRRRPPSATSVTPSAGDFAWLTEDHGRQSGAADHEAGPGDPHRGDSV